jgi:hypothetical protein
MNTTASILVNSEKQRMYFGDTVFLNNNTEFEIEFFNKNSRTVCPSITINGEKLKRSPVVYNGQKYVLKDYIDVNRKFLFKIYEVESNNIKVSEAIKNNGIIEIKYFYEKKSNEMFACNLDTFGNDDYSARERKLENGYIETGKIMKGSISSTKYNSIEIDLDSSFFETQLIKLLPVSRKPLFQDCSNCNESEKIDANYCSNCGHKFV